MLGEAGNGMRWACIDLIPRSASPRALQEIGPALARRASLPLLGSTARRSEAMRANETGGAKKSAA